MALQTNQTKRAITSVDVATEWLEENPHRKAENMTGQLASDKKKTRRYRTSNVHLFDKSKTKTRAKKGAKTNG